MFSILKSRAKSMNARAAAIAMAASAVATLLLTHTGEALSPLRILSLALTTFAAWAFCDEMGLRKPLNRAGLVCLSFAVACKSGAILGVAVGADGRYLLSYSALLMVSILFWSIAFLHRPAIPKGLGVIGVSASAGTILLVVIGHLTVGVASVFGLQSLLTLSNSMASIDLTFVFLVERLFGAWCCIVCWLLWRGHIRDAIPVTSRGGVD